MNYLNYEKERNAMTELNQKYLDLFVDDLLEKGLSQKTIRNHLSNVEFYINDFLCYYDVEPMVKGCYYVDEFLGDWFVRKAMWSNATSIKSNCSSFKKFYALMLEYNFITKKDYQMLITTIKDKKEYWVESVEEYNNSEYDW